MIGASGWLFENKSITMHGNMNVKFLIKCHSARNKATVAEYIVYPLRCTTRKRG